ncbi:MAG: efflux RND transporter permease subunit [Alphaproteobacteria bacterium]|nr:efflux RND transporter permease subunit [Alphaproteobacteria bacterium]
MFSYLIHVSLTHRVFVLCATAVLVVLGTLQVRGLPVDVLPEIDRSTVAIITEGNGLSPEEVERRITFPIETAMAGVKGLERLRSTSSSSLSIVFVDFGLNADIYRNRQLVAERLTLAREQMPAGITPEMGPIASVMGEILLIAMTSDSGDMMALRDLADWTVRPRLLAIPGVAQILILGGDARQLRVTPDPRMLDLFDLSIEQIETAVARYNANTGGDAIEQYGSRYLIMNVGRIRDPEELVAGLKDLVVTYQGGRGILLRQVATISFEPRIKQGDAGFMGKKAIIVRVHKQPGVNTLRLTADVQRVLAELRPFLPKEMHADKIAFKQAKFIETSIRNLTRVLIEATAVVSVVLFAFLLNLRTTIISLTAIPISLFITAIVFWFFDMTINTMTLGGLAIAIGELVDDAVVGVENMFRRLRQNRQLANPRPPIEVIADATIEVRSGIFYATIIVLLVFFPLFSLPGLEGLMFKPLALSYIVSILASLVTSVTLTPVLAYYLLPRMKRMANEESGLVRFLKRQNERLLLWAFDHQSRIIATAVTLVAIAVVGAVYLPRAFLPPLNEGMYVVGLTFRPSISLGQSSRMGAVAEKLLLEVPEVTSIGRRTGRAELDVHADGIYQNEIDVDLAPSSRSTADVLQDIRNRLSALPGTVYIGQPLTHRINVAMSGLPAQIAVKIYGDDLDSLFKLADGLRDRLAGVPGLTDLKLETQARVPQVRVRVDADAARLYGITPAHLTQTLEAFSAGHVVSQIVDESRRYNVLVRLDDKDRTRAGLAQLLINTPVGRVPLRDLATIIDTDGPNQIIRENGLRRIAILANTDGSDMAAISKGIEAQAAAMRMPAGYFVSIEGNYEAQQRASLRIGVLSLISLLLIFAILYSRYDSTVLSLIIMANVPLSLIGSVVLLWLLGGTMSLATMIGFITLVGISTRNGILKISHYINLVLNEGETFGRKMILRGSLERMTPVLMTALSAGLAVIPLILGGDEPGKEILSPVAVVILGGLISATLFDAVLTPILFLRYGEKALSRLRDRVVIGKKAEAY